MAKGLGIIGNFKGKVGNIVGYNLKDSNNKQTQGLRAYQPVVRNPKTAAQAEQRAKMAPINATYRALKGIIDRGQEGVAYGNKSRLRFLSEAMKQFDGPWFEKGEAVTLLIKTNITRGSLSSISVSQVSGEGLTIDLRALSEGNYGTIGALSSDLLDNNSFLKEGDQLTIVHGDKDKVSIVSIVLNPADNTSLSGFRWNEGKVVMSDSLSLDTNTAFGCAILSREGESGQHLRSTTALTLSTDAAASDYYKNAAKDAAIESYMAANGNTDWPEEQL